MHGKPAITSALLTDIKAFKRKLNTEFLGPYVHNQTQCSHKPNSGIF